ncbi:MAG: histidine phosphatase family protein, partial [Casimicrobium sp.]
ASAEQVLQAIDWPESDDMIVVVGHQPWMGDCIASLLNLETQQTLSVKKSAAWWLQRRVRDDEQGIVLRAVVTPELL